ncbi:cell wall-binding repeat-containing protein [Leifsonia sp. RAF41]|uniref:cell wall-binding repeat-containing protein n=1 Tax=Leifsonia sp. RAF41 TaxID=3233056 RepID=UPI003F9E5A06
MAARGKARIRLVMALATAAALTAGAVGAAAPAAAQLVRIGDRILLPATYTVPGVPSAQSETALQTGPDGHVWLTTGTDVVRFAADGTATRFAGYPSGTPTSVSALYRYSDGFLYLVRSADAGFHWMHITTAGQVDEIALPNGVAASDLWVPTPSPDGSVWFDRKPTGTSTDPGMLIRLSGGAVTTFPTPTRIRSIVPTDDGGAYARTATVLVRAAPDGSSTPIAATAAYFVNDSWPGTDGSLWFRGQSKDTDSAVVAMVRSDGTLDVASPAYAWSFAPVSRTAQAVTWIVGNDSSSNSSVALVGTAPSSLHRIPLPVPPSSGFAVGNGRLWAAGEGAPSSGNITVASAGPSGDVRVEGTIEDFSVSQLASAADGTVWAVGSRPSATSSSANRAVAIQPDGSVLFGSSTRTFSGPATFTPDGTPWFAAPGGVMTLRQAAADRLDGDSRYDAAATIAKAAFPTGAPVVYVASGQNFPDALSAGPVAAADGGTLLLTLPGSLPTATRDAITALAPSKLVVVGGTASVSSGVLDQLRGLVPDVTRITGPDRYAVSHDLVASHQKPGKPLFVATGAGYADAVTAGAAAARAGGQLLLVPGSGAGLPAGYASFIAGLAPSTIAVVGGTETISDGILSQLNGIAPATRYGGEDRYAVSAAVVSAFGSPSAHVYLTTGRNFPDALAAAPLAGRADATLVSVPGTCVPASALSAIDAARPSAVTSLGGTDSVGVDASWLAGC